MGGVRPRILVLGSLLGAVVFGAYWLVDTPDGERPELQRSLAAAADAAGDGGTVDLASVADFPWDRLHVIGAYTPDDVIATELGFDWQPHSRLDGMLFPNILLDYDSRQLMVFVRGDRDVTGWLILNLDVEQPPIGFGFDGVPPILSRNEAVFGAKSGPSEEPGWSLSLTSDP